MASTVTAYVEQGGSAVVAGGDLFLGTQYNEYEYLDDSGFSTLRLDDEWFGRIDTPKTVDLVGEALLQRKLVILGGPLLKEKSALARHVAWRTLQPRDEGPALRDGRQRRCGIADPPLEKALHDAEEPTLFVLWDAEPRHLEHDVRRVLGWLEESPHCLLVTTDSIRASFGLGDESPLRHLWWELETHQVYSAEYRFRLLLASLGARTGGSLPEDLFPEGKPSSLGDAERPLVAGLPLGRAVDALETPEQIVLLARLLVDPPGLLDAETVDQEISRIAGDRSAVEGWYRRLSPRQQLLVSGIVFFEGLFDDQLFAALDILVEEAWRPRQPMLECFDYQDLDELERYIRFPRSSAGGEPVECRSEQLRQSLLEAAWRHRRRQMMVILPLVSDLVRRSGRMEWSRRMRGEARFAHPEALPDRASDLPAEESDAGGVEPGEGEGLPVSRSMPYGPERELLGLAPRRRRLYAVVRRSLADLGLLSPYSVERCLYEMASDGSWEAQSVAAQTLWSWRRTPRESRMFQILKAWHGEGRGLGRSPGSAPGPSDYVHKTIALTVFYAAVGEPPDGLHEDAVVLLTRLADERSRTHHPVVRESVRRQTLPAAVRWHRRQLDPVLRELIADHELVEPIAVGWARALASRPRAAVPPLTEWPQPDPRTMAAVAATDGRRELRIATVALTYGLADYRDRRVPLSSAEAAAAAGGFLSEPHPFVRWHVFRAVERLILGYFEEVEEPLRDVAERVSLGERGELLRPFLRLAREPSRPAFGPLRSVVEERLEPWVCDPTRPAAQQIAFETLVAIAGIDVGEQPAPVPAGRLEAAGAAAGTTEQATLRELPWIAGVILGLVTLGRSEHRAACVAPAAELIHQLEARPRAVGTLLAGWSGRTGPLGGLGRTLRSVVTWYRRRRAVWIALAVLAMLALVAASIGLALAGAA